MAWIADSSFDRLRQEIRKRFERSRQIHGLHFYAEARFERRRRKIEHRFHSSGHNLIQDSLRDSRRHRDNDDIDRLIANDSGDPVNIEDLNSAARALADFTGVVIKQRRHREARLLKTIIIRQRPSQSPGAYDSHAVRLVETKNLRQVHSEIFDEVSRAPNPKLAEIAEVFSDLGRIQVELFSQFLRRDGFDSRRL